MAPSLTETSTIETPAEALSHQVGSIRLNQEPEKQEDVCAQLVMDNRILNPDITAQKGPSYPFYYPYWDVNEKFPPTEIHGELPPSLVSNSSLSLLQSSPTLAHALTLPNPTSSRMRRSTTSARI